MDEKLTGVVVTTEHRGVFFGYVPEGTVQDEARTITLRRARNCIYWSEKVKGFLGLAATGPDSQSRIGPAVPSLTLTGVTSVAEATPDACAAWEANKWMR